MAKAEDVARQLRAWAAEKGVLTYTPADQEEEEPIDLEKATSTAEAHAAEQILNIRKINLICVDDEHNSVIVYTHKVPTKKEQEELPDTLKQDVHVEFKKGTLLLLETLQDILLLLGVPKSTRAGIHAAHPCLWAIGLGLGRLDASSEILRENCSGSQTIM